MAPNELVAHRAPAANRAAMAVSFMVVLLCVKLGSRIPVAITPFEIAELFFRLILGDAVLLLDLAGEQIALAGDHIQLVVGQLAPLLFRLALDLLPVAFDAIPIHLRLLR